MMEFYDQKMVKARKLHYCEFCGKTIGGGEQYSREIGKYEGDFFERKLCLTCHEMLEQFCKVTEDEVLQWSWIQDWLREEYCDEKCRKSCEYGFSRVQSCPIVRKKFKEPLNADNYLEGN